MLLKTSIMYMLKIFHGRFMLFSAKFIPFFALICLIYNIQATENPCGERYPRIYTDDTSFVVIYYNSIKKAFFMNRYTANGNSIYLTKEITDSDIVDTVLYSNAINEGIADMVPTGKNNPLGNYFPPYGRSFLKDTILYTITNSDLRLKKTTPFLEIKRGKTEKEVYDLDWKFNKLNKIQQIIVSNSLLKSISEKIFRIKWDLEIHKYIDIKKIFVDGNLILGIAEFEELDTIIKEPKCDIEFFIVNIGDKYVKYVNIDSATENLFKDLGYHSLKSIKKYRDKYVFIWGNEKGESYVCSWNLSENSIKNYKLPKNILCNLFSTYNIIDDNMLIANMKQENPKDYCSNKIVVNHVKIPFN